ncbi:M23 family metallopeptidase [Conexibacter sp. JD483]|uniref:M23 family metallopeptidase n=1 Tax=unclassified Conexibacter TaxID=2627773 RepID=UPI002723703F|nr:MULTISPECIES: M23 family metallopeptidase [unclassified Conexibacter]MDO8183982.1 M23 family metallopeptidase [Conexibacter sp. CPCC 205706]MDO8196974.1 M23 family metallopeptidase [Conexibacter sp. CPCC 205762]MDR9369056.1 M23 family metallopeptidase [Conexibacter sp. JD483]
MALGAVSLTPAPGLATSGGAAPNVATGARTGGADPNGESKPKAAPKKKAAKKQPKRAVAKQRRARRKPKRAPAAPAPVTPAPVDDAPAADTVAGIFPVAGSFTFGGDDARFGAGRPGHIHQGQDVVAASGTPIVAPVAGTIVWKANQPGGAGIYVVLRGAADGRDYVFMHLKSGSVLVEADSAVSAGQQLAEVGATGVASGPHLHFEIWVGGWQARGGAPIDPLPQLQRWANG